jgi:hypothetical protein
LRPTARENAMLSPTSKRPDQARAASGNTAVWILAGVSAVLLGVVIFLLTRGKEDSPRPDGPRSSQNDEVVVVSEGKTIKREELPKESPAVHEPKDNPPPKKIDKPERVKETLEVGKTYRVIQRICFESRGQDPDWGPNDQIQVGYVIETLYNRTIESNDGRKIVEVRHVEWHRGIKVLSGGGKIGIERGPENEVVLGLLESIPKDKWGKFVSCTPIESFLAKVAPSAVGKLTESNTKIKGLVNRLSGKKVRLTSRDGKGTIGVEAIEGGLNAWERDFFFSKDVTLFSRFLIALSEIRVGEEWTFDGNMFSELLELMDHRPMPRVGGKVVVQREKDTKKGGKEFANISIKAGDDSELNIREGDSRADVSARYHPRGTMKFSLTENHVTTALLDGKIRIAAVPKDGPLRNTTLIEEPILMISYSCEKR